MQNSVVLNSGRIENQDKLQILTRALRSNAWDIMMLSELHGEGQAVVFIKEFMMTANKRAALWLSPFARTASIAGGSQYGFVGERFVWARLVTAE